MVRGRRYLVSPLPFVLILYSFLKMFLMGQYKYPFQILNICIYIPPLQILQKHRFLPIFLAPPLHFCKFFIRVSLLSGFVCPQSGDGCPYSGYVCLSCVIILFISFFLPLLTLPLGPFTCSLRINRKGQQEQQGFETQLSLVLPIQARQWQQRQ